MNNLTGTNKMRIWGYLFSFNMTLIHCAIILSDRPIDYLTYSILFHFTMMVMGTYEFLRRMKQDEPELYHGMTDN